MLDGLQELGEGFGGKLPQRDGVEGEEGLEQALVFMLVSVRGSF